MASLHKTIQQQKNDIARYKEKAEQAEQKLTKVRMAFCPLLHLFLWEHGVCVCRHVCVCAYMHACVRVCVRVVSVFVHVCGVCVCKGI